ncbi:hypothetical protein GGI21_002136 [Coemansia aciculifera]|uniref:Uncharacterized protein n=1 Tax=Coemansia aciculifera TaxID=417176 RepID=A0ACC1M8L6_9FUNG|nr:hypothetical protein IWW38_001251 [Coemansia aciculifera]KAJ2909186.1 hypothetical protein GGI21_002136 [Coemansia aciculifera]
MSDNNKHSKAPITISVAKYRSGPGFAPLGQPGIVGPTLSTALLITGTPTGGAKVVRHEHKEDGKISVKESDLTGQALESVFAAVGKLQTLPKREVPGGPDVYGANTSVEVRQGSNVIWSYGPGRGCCVQSDDDDNNEVAALGIDDSHKASFVSIVQQLCDATAPSAPAATSDKKE